MSLRQKKQEEQKIYTGVITSVQPLKISIGGVEILQNVCVNKDYTPTADDTVLALLSGDTFYILCGVAT